VTEFKKGDKVRMTGDPDNITGTVLVTGRCKDQGDPTCDSTAVTYQDDHGIHTTHTEDLEPAN
jgi:hypothetical protein